MSQEAWDSQVSEPNVVSQYIKFTGAGAAPVVKVNGRGTTCTRTGVGLVNLVFDENMGTYVGVMGWCFEATVQAGVKGYTVVPGVYNTTTRTLTLNITNQAEALTDLAAAQQLSIMVAFKRTNA
jgi:hypothetical protein